MAKNLPLHNPQGHIVLVCWCEALFSPIIATTTDDRNDFPSP